MAKRLYKFYIDFGRMGSIEGLFIFDEARFDCLEKIQIYDFDILGKHSEVNWEFSKENCKIIDLDESVIDTLSLHLTDDISGYTPWGYMDQIGDYFDENPDEENPFKA